MRKRVNLTKNRLDVLVGVASGYDSTGDSASNSGSGSREYNAARDYLLDHGLVVIARDRLWLTGSGIRELGKVLGKLIANSDC